MEGWRVLPVPPLCSVTETIKRIVIILISSVRSFSFSSLLAAELEELLNKIYIFTYFYMKPVKGTL